MLYTLKNFPSLINWLKIFHHSIGFAGRIFNGCWWFLSTNCDWEAENLSTGLCANVKIFLHWILCGCKYIFVCSKYFNFNTQSCWFKMQLIYCWFELPLIPICLCLCQGSWITKMVRNLRHLCDRKKSFGSHGAESVYRSNCICAIFLGLFIVCDWLFSASRCWKGERQTPEWLHRYPRGQLQCVAVGTNHQFQHHPIELSSAVDTNSCSFLEYLLFMAYEFERAPRRDQFRQCSVIIIFSKFECQHKCNKCNLKRVNLIDLISPAILLVV